MSANTPPPQHVLAHPLSRAYISLEQLKVLEKKINNILIDFQKKNKCGLFIDVDKYSPTVVKIGVSIDISK